MSDGQENAKQNSEMILLANRCSVEEALFLLAHHPSLIT
jgi:hypothetical protein